MGAPLGVGTRVGAGAAGFALGLCADGPVEGLRAGICTIGLRPVTVLWPETKVFGVGSLLMVAERSGLTSTLTAGFSGSGCWGEHILQVQLL